MELKYAHLADYATRGLGGKPVIIGIFDNVMVPTGNAIGLPICYLIGAFIAHLSEGSRHKLRAALTDEDGAEVMTGELDLEFSPTPQRTLEAVFSIGILGLPLPHMGAYEFNLFVDGTRLGSVSIYVAEAPPQ